ncbi:MAG: hypothetical protein IJR68_12915 [Fretibacterium sp.]|nr:hypothetical protein [Fretibacterium sp.]
MRRAGGQRQYARAMELKRRGSSNEDLQALRALLSSLVPYKDTEQILQKVDTELKRRSEGGQ